MKIVIIGGGIAGLTAGILLQRKGYEVVINEREPDIPNRGNAFLMHAEADAILKRLTFDFQKARIPGKLIDSFCLRRPDNRIARFQKLDPWHCVTRKDIIGLLYKLVPEGLVIHNNRRFTGFHAEHGKVVTAVFENGETESGDLFIGADGGNSEVRQCLFGPTTYTPVEVREVLGGVHAPGLSAALRSTFSKYQHEHLGLSCGIIPTSVNGVVWYMQYDCSANDPKGNSPEELKEFCLTMLKDFPQLVTDTIRMDDFSNTYIWNTRDFDLLPRFHSGNVVLVGDSAHLSLPFTSAGTTNAFVDAATLADLLPKPGVMDDDFDDLFTAYYDTRAGRIASQIQLGRDLKKAFRFPEESTVPSIPLIGRPENRRTPPASDSPPIRIFYFTDPICSTCWASQPQLRKLYLEYGGHVEVEYKMGGLLPSWDNFSRNGIRTPSDVAVHWEEVCAFYNMPIDKQIWLEDPLPSSYPPSIAFKAAQLQDTAKAIVFLRRIREMVFMEKKNIIHEEFLTAAAYEVGLDTIRLMRDLNGVAKDLFREDLRLTEQLKVTTLPTLYFAEESEKSPRTFRLEGFQPYTAYEEMIRQILPEATKINYDRSPEALFTEFHTMTLREFAYLRDEPESESHLVLKDLAARNLIRKFESEAGNIWLSNFNSMEIFK